jgi:hypothetical protein
MSLLTATPSQVRVRVRTVREKVPDAKFIGIQARAVWSGPATVQVGGLTVPVITCASPLAFRQALVEHAASPGPVVLITDRQPRELGQDALARLAKQRLFDLDPWQVVLDLFRAREWDRQLGRQAWLGKALLDHAPDEGYPPVWTGVLDADTVWRHVLERRFGLSETADLPAVLRWAETSPGVARLLEHPVDERHDVVERLARTAGPFVGRVLDAVQAGQAREVVAIGLAARVLACDARDREPALREATIRLEPLLGGRALPLEGLRAWADAAESLVRGELGGPGGRAAVGPWLERAEALLERLGARPHAHASALLPAGLAQRLASFGARLGAVLGRRPLEPSLELQLAAEAVGEHELARRGEVNLDTVSMAVRLLRWVTAREARPAPSAASFADAFRAYVEEGAWVDRARAKIWDEGQAPALRQAYADLLARVGALREAGDRRFGELLASFVAAGAQPPADVLPIERVLEQVVAPLVRSTPVLLVVLDGMSQAVLRELEEDLVERAGWTALAPESGALPQVLAAFPTLTEVCRASLLAGTLVRGDDGLEARKFAEHAGLRAAVGARKPAVLFHKGPLGARGTSGLSAEVHAALADLERPLVGAVVNAIDDHLAKGDQVRVRWDALHIAPLDALLNAAREAGRVVVLASDHGHVIERGTRRKESGDGERWRADQGPPDPDDVVLAGPRVLAAGGRIRAPWREAVRYGSGVHHGYHGGASPAEVVVPLAVLCSGRPPTGWREVRTPRPEWWTRDVAPDPAHAAPAPREAGPLFESVPVAPAPPPVPAWIEALLASATFERQLQTAARAKPSPERIRQVLEALHARGGKLTEAALATQVGLPALRLTGILASMRRILNVDGYPVLSKDQETISLDLGLLRRQFGLGSE